jgi:protein subunit release factor A
LAKELLFTIYPKEFKVEYFCAGGHGGQGMQKNATACRITHIVSGATGISRDERSQLQNKKLAFKRLTNSEKFKAWHKLEVAKRLSQYEDDKQWVEEQMRPENLKIEVIKLKKEKVDV